MAKQTIAVVMGGPSAEHDISVKSGEAVLANLDRKKYTTTKVYIDHARRWFIDEQAHSATEAMAYLQKKRAVVFNALHGTYGEDGTLQALCQRHDIPFTGSGVSSSLLAMDKASANEIFAGNELLLPQSLTFSQDDGVLAIIKDTLSVLDVPLVVKPARQGSSVGVHIVHDEANLETAVENAFLYDQNIIVQQYIKGTELSCGVLQTSEGLIALPPTELCPVISEFFDFKAKYTPGGTDEITPAPIGTDTVTIVQDIAKRAHALLGCKTYSRTDVIMNDEGMYIIETNTLPGLTPQSIYPQQLAAEGISFSDFLDCVLAEAGYNT